MPFTGVAVLMSVTISNSIGCIGIYAFGQCSGLTSITCLASTLPHVEHSFAGVKFENCTLFVPKKAKKQYQKSKDWNAFSIATIAKKSLNQGKDTDIHSK